MKCKFMILMGTWLRQSSPLKMGIWGHIDPFPGSCWLVASALTPLSRPHFKLQPSGVTPVPGPMSILAEFHAFMRGVPASPNAFSFLQQ